MHKNISPFFEPNSVVLVGASSKPGKPGFELLKNIQANDYSGEVYLVNPKAKEILGYRVHNSIESLPEGIDLAIVIVPSTASPTVLRQCARRGIQHCILLAGGFAELDETGEQLQQELIQIIQKYNLQVIGPNTSGHISTPSNFTSSFFPLGKIRRGKVSYIAQTGNFATHTMKNILSSEYFGIARVIGLGNKLDIDESDALEYLANDQETDAILIYLESFKRPRRFLKIAREITQTKPVVMLKSGTSEEGRKAAVAHTAAMAEEDRLVDGMLRQAGVVRIHQYTHLILCGKAFSMIPLPKGNRVCFLAPSGAMLVVLSDLCSRLGLEVPAFSPESQKRIEEISPPYIRMRNPVDIWGAATMSGVESGYRDGIEAALSDPKIDAVVPILMLTKDFEISSFDFLVELAGKYPEKPLLVTYSGEEEIMRECKEYLEPLGVPTFFHVEQPFEILSILSRCRNSLGRPN